MSEPKDRTLTRVDMTKVFLDEKGEPYFLKFTETFKFNTWKSDFDLDPSDKKTERVTPLEMGLTKTQEQKIYVRKIEKDELEDKTVFYEMPITYVLEDTRANRYKYFRKVKSGRIFLVDIESGVSGEAGINSEYVKRGKARKLPENTLISKNAPIYTLNASGELELRLDSNAVW